jgi:alpha-L-fucosidase
MDLAQGAQAVASNVRGNDARFAAVNVLDGRRQKYWSTDDGVTTPELVLELGKRVTFNIVSLREFLPLGQRVDDWVLDRWAGGAWVEFASGTAIGARRLWRGDNVTTEKVRLRIVKASVCPALSEFALYLEPDWARKGVPGKQQVRGTSKSNWKVVSAWPAKNRHGSQATLPEIVIDLGNVTELGGFTYLPRSDSATRGIVDQYEFYVSSDGVTWGQPVIRGEFGNIQSNPIQQVVNFAKPAKGRFVKFVALHGADESSISMAELGVLPK